MPLPPPHHNAFRPPAQAKTLKRRRYRAARAFYVTVFIGVCLATYSLLKQPVPGRASRPGVLKRQDLRVLRSEDEECRLVHRAADQCAFIAAHCPADEAGFSAYLRLYFCSLQHAKPLAFLLLIAWLGLLFSTIGIAASDFFCINLSTIASILGMSESMAGVTFLAFGNGSPDVFSTFAAMSTNSGSLAVGELIGAAGFITAVVAGSMALIRPFHVARKSFVRDVGFFVVAAAFSMVFLYDGKLHLWECLTMVGFYVFYVAFVVVWHWWLGRRRRRREKEAAARAHFITPGDELDVEHEEYHDDPEETPRPDVSRGASAEDFSALESAMPYTDYELDEDEEEEARGRWMSELNDSMRLGRSRARSRRNTITPIRPSLVGALEFQAVLKSLQRSRNHQTIPMASRRYSDGPTFTSAQQQDEMSFASDPASRPPYQLKINADGTTPVMERPSLSVPQSAPDRARAASANDAARLRIDLNLRRDSHSYLGSAPLPSEGGNSHLRTPSNLSVPTDGTRTPVFPKSPTIAFSPAPPAHEEPPMDAVRDSAPIRSPSDHLAPPDGDASLFTQRSDPFARTRRGSILDLVAPGDSPRSIPQSRMLPKIIIPREERRSSPHTSQPSSPFPAYRDELSPGLSRPPSIYLPPPSLTPESRPEIQEALPSKRPTKWWPYSLLPPPGVLISTLFPTIYHWREKGWIEKCLGIVSAPPVFLLTITLPVVENDKDKDDESDPKTGGDSYSSMHNRSASMVPRQPNSNLLPHENDNDQEFSVGMHHHGSIATKGVARIGGSAAVAIDTERQQRHNVSSSTPTHHASIAVDQPDLAASPTSFMPPQPEPWNRWLTILQLFTAPLFIVLAIYSQSPTDISPLWLLKPVLICLLISLTLLIPLLLTTTPTHRPAFYKAMLALTGFVVSVSWISSIAAQVVGALKALAVILNMSHAIMGLTIFAVGNSLGDFVADVTVAKLGYPVMALSACFGGPMLNILLGIGLSGSYILMRGAQHRRHKHPDEELVFGSYKIEVDGTLVVSGITLLVTLVGLLIAVPCNKWVMSKRLGWVLIALWCASTVGNVLLEITGWANGPSEG